MVDKLKSIGFYTLCDHRAVNCSHTSPLWRCELLVTSRCNFNCPYCRTRDIPDLSLEQAAELISYWVHEGLRNIRFSGGEPTIWSHLEHAIRMCNHMQNIAISTNGSADYELYERLVEAGVNDFSVSLDACCASTGALMAGKDKMWEHVTSNIRKLSKLTYVTVGVVLTQDNIGEAEKIIEFADGLGVADIRIIPAAQVSKHLPNLKVPDHIRQRHPILNYRLTNAEQGKRIRGLSQADDRRCALVLDDMAVENGKHYPCIIYLRENGKSIGDVGSNMRQERLDWFIHHDCQEDGICRNNCLDVCVNYNNRVTDLENK